MKKFLGVILPAVILLSLSGCSNSESSKEEESVSSAIKTEISDAENESPADSIKTISSSLNSPLGFEEWGAAAKFSTAEQKYFNVPVRILSVTKGEAAKKEVKLYAENSDEFIYSEPEKGEEWVVAEYELSLDGFPVDSEGADVSVTSFVAAADGGYIQKDGKNQSTVTVSMIDSEYYFEGIRNGKIAFILPEQYNDYMVILGEYNETQAYFKEE